MGMGASTGAARDAASVYAGGGMGVIDMQVGVGPTDKPLLRAFPGTQVQLGSVEFWIWAIFLGALAYMLGVHWLLGSGRAIVRGV